MRWIIQKFCLNGTVTPTLSKDSGIIDAPGRFFESFQGPLQLVHWSLGAHATMHLQNHEDKVNWIQLH